MPDSPYCHTPLALPARSPRFSPAAIRVQSRDDGGIELPFLLIQAPERFPAQMLGAVPGGHRLHQVPGDSQPAAHFPQPAVEARQRGDMLGAIPQARTAPALPTGRRLIQHSTAALAQGAKPPEPLPPIGTRRKVVHNARRVYPPPARAQVDLAQSIERTLGVPPDPGAGAAAAQGLPSRRF
jgi:hypothetical protein